MPKLPRLQDPRLPIDNDHLDGLILFPEQAIIVDGGGKVPLPKPPIVGTDNPETIHGTDGNDTIYAKGGDDWIYGEKGADKMFGGEGNDNYFVDNPNDVVVENPGEGWDTVRSKVDYHMPDNVEVLMLEGSDAIDGWTKAAGGIVIGNDNTNMLYGSSNADSLDGGKGADGMFGGDGGDTYYVDNPGDVIWELEDQGFDMVHSTISYILGQNLERLYLEESGGAINGTGNEDNNSIYGNSSKNVLKGGSGDDWLDGKGGNDTMYGGDDNDTFVVDSINDLVIEYQDEGYDTVYATSTFFLSNNVETLMLKNEGGAINGYGNDGDNFLYGNNFANTLGGYAGTDYIRGYGGKDILDGGTGNDHLWGGEGDDTFSFHGTFGTDWIYDFKAGGDHDVIELDHNQFADFAAVQAATTQLVGSVKISLDADHTIYLDGVNAADLHASDFHFV